MISSQDRPIWKKLFQECRTRLTRSHYFIHRFTLKKRRGDATWRCRVTATEDKCGCRSWGRCGRLLVGEYLEGWFEKRGTRMYVSRGVGTSIFDVRFCC